MYEQYVWKIEAKIILWSTYFVIIISVSVSEVHNHSKFYMLLAEMIH